MGHRGKSQRILQNGSHRSRTSTVDSFRSGHKLDCACSTAACHAANAASAQPRPRVCRKQRPHLCRPSWLPGTVDLSIETLLESIFRNSQGITFGCRVATPPQHQRVDVRPPPLRHQRSDAAVIGLQAQSAVCLTVTRCLRSSVRAQTSLSNSP